LSVFLHELRHILKYTSQPVGRGGLQYVEYLRLILRGYRWPHRWNGIPTRLWPLLHFYF